MFGKQYIHIHIHNVYERENPILKNR
jgi:hypothetical protein